MWTLAGEDAEVVIDLEVDGQFVAPDAGSITVTLRDKEGVAIPDWNKSSLPNTDKSQVSFTIPGALTFLETAEQLGAIYVKLEWKSEGTPYSVSRIIRLAHFAPIQASEDGVRNRLGAGRDEIPNSSIDLYAAYYRLLPMYPDVLPTALRSGVASACLAANNSIEIQAALVHLPALAAKLAQVDTQENTSKTRMKMDLDKLEESLRNSLDQELAEMEATLIGQSTSTVVTNLLLVTPTDVITGA
jgi:hypothetical protein